MTRSDDGDFDPTLLDILACPQCKGELEYQEKPLQSLICKKCRLIYPISKGIPELLAEAAKPI